MGVRVTLPQMMTLQDWADQITLDLDKFGVVGRYNGTMDWQDWAVQMLRNMSLNGNLPVPYQFNDWRDWAERFCQSVE